MVKKKTTKTKTFKVPSTLYFELQHAAMQKHQSLKEYLNSLFEALLMGTVVEQ